MLRWFVEHVMANFGLPIFVYQRVGTTGLPASGRNFSEAVQHKEVTQYKLSYPMFSHCSYCMYWTLYTDTISYCYYVFIFRGPYRSRSFSTMTLNSMIYQSNALWVSASTLNTLTHNCFTLTLHCFLIISHAHLSLQTWCSSWVTCRWKRITLKQPAWATSYWSVLIQTVYLWVEWTLNWNWRMSFSLLFSSGRKRSCWEMKSTARSSSKLLTTQLSECVIYENWLLKL